MEIEALNCRCCGGVLKVKSSLCECEYCGATNFISDVASKYVNQLNRANKLRQEREFDNAARIYDTILQENAPTADILWLRTLCEYGIEYVPDPVADKYIPTLHRVKDESILAYHSYIDALALADKEQKETLEKEAEYINNIQTEYLNIAANEQPYDVFICYKETDDNTGEKTEDMELAEQLYGDLTVRGFKVFFAKETLKTKLSIDYEPYIFAALKSARAMVVLGTKAEYFMSVWVKNEWGRFLKLMQEDSSKQMFFACDDPEELPRAFATKQAQLLGEENAIKNLANNIEKFLLKEAVPQTVTDFGRESLYIKAVGFLRARDFSNADLVIEKLLFENPEYAPGYWLRMLSSYKTNPSNIEHMQLDIFSNRDYIKAVKYAEGKLKEDYTKTAEIRKNNLAEQEKFDKVLEAKSINYIRTFENTPTGRKKNEILEKIVRSAETVDIYNNKIRLSAAIGTVFFLGGNFLYFILAAVTGFARGYVDNLLWLTLLTAPIILIGVAVLFSYNLVVDLVTTALVCLFLILSVFTRSSEHIFMHVLAIILTAAVYIITSQSHTLNNFRIKRVKASLEIEKLLEELRTTVESAGDDINKFAARILKEYKEQNNISTVLEIKEENYFKGLRKIKNIYEETQKDYLKYVGVSIPAVRASYQKNESGLSIGSFALSMVPPLGAFSCIVAIIDLASDKYKEHRHFLSILSLAVNFGTIIIILFIISRL